ncbi:Hypothetical predicted protein [Olea europaea subsp. europaea]|uniref:Uncharacterized protein n=1 Tax=Olea europaea subsp. europaea TaxID=158383 RepID=A0A8S0PRL8_OLEEU|nr:Hypothetical predicted protein [Olea europaea subsp. europaea]
MACTLSPRNCQEMPEKNQAVSLSRLGHLPDMAFTSCPQKAYKCLKIRIHPYCVQDTSLHIVYKNFPQMLENEAASLTWPECISIKACIPYPKKLPRNACKSSCVPATSWTWPAHRVLQTIKKCLKIRLHPCSNPDASRKLPAHHVQEIA